MPKINISFDNKNYNISEASLSSASAKLKSHLSTVMSGSGSVINLDGVSYNIDSTKLANATNDFVSHLGTISGNGYKVVVGGIEYTIDSTKMSDVVDYFSDILGSLSNSDDVTDEIVNYKSETVVLDENSTSLAIGTFNNVGYLVNRAPYFYDSDCYVVVVNDTEFIIDKTKFMKSTGALKATSSVVGKYNDAPILCTLKYDRRTGLGTITVEFTTAPTEPVSAYLIYKTVNVAL